MELKCFSVGEHDYVAAYDAAGARAVMVEMCGVDAYGEDGILDSEIEEVSSEFLAKHWTDEDSGESCGTLKEWLAEAEEPKWLAGTE